jgi:hypothetical protein
MAAGLGNVLFWVAKAIAILLLVIGALLGWTEFMEPAFGPYSDYGPMALLLVVALGTWMLGRACLYGLAGR